MSLSSQYFEGHDIWGESNAVSTNLLQPCCSYIPSFCMLQIVCFILFKSGVLHVINRVFHLFQSGVLHIINRVFDFIQTGCFTCHKSGVSFYSNRVFCVPWIGCFILFKSGVLHVITRVFYFIQIGCFACHWSTVSFAQIGCLYPINRVFHFI